MKNFENIAAQNCQHIALIVKKKKNQPNTTQIKLSKVSFNATHSQVYTLKL